MTTALIPEVIQPGVLYSPNSDNFFTLETTDVLPNTDEALNITAATNSDTFRAYQPAIAGIHYPAAITDPFSVLFWYRSNAGLGSPASGLRTNQIFMGVMDATAPVLGGNTSSTTGMRWLLSLGTNSSSMRQFTMHIAVGATSRAYLTGGEIVPTTTDWSGVALRSPGSPGSPNGVDFSLNTIATTLSAGAAGTPGAVVNPYFSLGPFSRIAGWGSPYASTIMRIAKIALFNYAVTNAEILDLNDSMMNGPPSP